MNNTDINAGFPNSADVDITLIAGENIGAYLVVSLHSDGLAYIADAATVTDAGQVVGIATSSGLTGFPLTVRTASQLNNAGFSFTVGAQQYLGLAGALTESPNTGLFELPLGIAQSATRMFLEIGTPIIFA